MARIKVLKGKQAGAVFDLGPEVFLGRDDDNHIQILDETCSRHHARIRRFETRYAVTDLGSNNGTFVNGEKSEESVLKDADRILIGNTLLVFEEAVGTAFEERGTVLHDGDSPHLQVASSVSVQEPVRFVQERRADRLERLYEVARTLAELLDLDALLPRIVDLAIESVRAERACLLWTDAQGGDRRAAVVRPEGRPAGDDIPVSDTIVTRALTEGRALLVRDARIDAGLQRQDSVVRFQVGSVLCVPLIVRGERLGALYLDSGAGGRSFQEDDLAFVTGVGQMASLAIANARRFSDCRQEIAELRRGATPGGAGIIGRSPKFSAVLALIDKVAPSGATCLLTGETGTGKEVLARALHDRSPRRPQPFIAINCAALVETLLESELFGHEKGAFTGAVERRKGKFELAHTGTLFLDEVGEMALSTQVKLLRVLQERQFYAIGGNKPISVDVRVIAATNRKLPQLVREGKFREDLYYRLCVVVIPIPPLRERPEDVPQLVYHFLERAAREIKKPVKGVTNAAMDILQRYPWPGNVRELQNVMERCVVLADGTQIDVDVLPLDLRGEAALAADPASTPAAAGVGAFSLREAEKQAMIRALAQTGGKKGETARLLGISWPTLNRKLEEYGLQPDRGA